MQCNQPFWCTGYQNPAQFSPYQIYPHFRDVTGEGDVMPLVLPDGSVQYYFLPINRRDRWSPYCSLPNAASGWPSANNEVWFVRSILNTGPTSGINQQISNAAPFSRSYVNDSLPVQFNIQKFHNDNCTSTTDLHYFYPHLRYGWTANSCTAVQVEIPRNERTIFHYGTICNRPCYCALNIHTGTGTHSNENCCTTPMSVDETQPANNAQCGTNETIYGEGINHSALSSKYKSNSCECHMPATVRTSDKLVTTYADQACSSIEMKGRKTKAKTAKSKARSSSQELEECGSACYSGGVCSYTDQGCD